MGFLGSGNKAENKNRGENPSYTLHSNGGRQTRKKKMTNVIHAMEKNRSQKKRMENAGARSGKMANENKVIRKDDILAKV